MPRVVAEYRQEARRRILQAASRVLSDRGYHNTTMEDIAQELGVSKGAIYLYFRSKEDLVKETCRTAPDELREALKASFQGRDMVSGARDFIRESISKSRPSLGLYFDIIGEAFRSPAVRRALSHGYGQSLSVLAEFIEKLKKKGTISEDVDTASLARGLVAMHDGFLASIGAGNRLAEVSRAWDEMLRIMMKGIGGEEPGVNG